MGTDLKGKQLGRGLSQRKDGRYMARFTKKNGERPTYYSFKLQECKRWLADEQYADECGEDNQFKNATLDEWFDFWMNHIKKDDIREVTCDYYSQIYKSSISPYLGKKKISKILPIDYIEWMTHIQSKAIKDSSKALYIKVFRSIMKDAEVSKVIESSPCQCKKAPRGKPDEKIYLTYDGQKLFEENAKKFSYCDHFIFALNTGLRVGELRGLKWEDVDIVNSCIHISRSVKKLRHPYCFIVGEPKTESGVRTIPLTSAAIQCLQRIQNKNRTRKVSSAEWKDFIFTSKQKGCPVETNCYQYQLDKICELSGIPRITMHSLRHTFATRCVDAGMNIKVLSKILGHANTSITFNTYVHADDNQIAYELNKFEKFLCTNDSCNLKKMV